MSLFSKPTTSSKRIGIVGFGVVGKAMAEMLGGYYNIEIFDKNMAEANQKEINRCDLAIVCVPTPAEKDNSCDISIVEECISWIKTPVILIKSTIEIGTTDKLRKSSGKRIVFSPEYIAETQYDTSHRFMSKSVSTPFLTLGGDEDDCSYVADLFTPVIGPEKRINIVSAKEAELAKYMENTFIALKVAFMNECYDIAKKLNINWYKARECLLSDPRFNSMHTAVFTEDRGFSGKCLGKDPHAFIRTAQKAGYEPELMKAMLKSNKKVREE